MRNTKKLFVDAEGNNLLRAFERNAGDRLRRVRVYGAPEGSRG